MGARFKQSVVEGMRNMWHQLNEIARSHTSAQGSDQSQEEPEYTAGTSQGTRSLQYMGNVQWGAWHSAFGVGNVRESLVLILYLVCSLARSSSCSLVTV